MTFEQIVKMAKEDAKARFGAKKQNPVDGLTHTLRTMDPDAKPFWLYDEKKNDPTRSDTSWGPESPLGSGDTADRNTAFSAGLNIVFGGV